MASKLLTDRLLEKLDPKGERIEIWDAALPSFGYRATRRGRGAFFVSYRIAGVRRRDTVGRYPAIGLAAAREAARAVLAAVARGQDPAELRADQRRRADQERNAAESRVLAILVPRFILHYHRGVGRGGEPLDPPRNRSWRETERLFARHVLPRWEGRDIVSIGRADVAALLRAVTESAGPTTANRTLAAIRKMFSWAAGEPDLMETLPPTNPAARLAVARETRRDRFLAPAEIQLLWPILGRLGYPFGALIKLLLLTGQRRDEVAQMRWSQLPPLDADGRLPARKEDRIWTLPATAMKGGRRHEVPISTLAATVIEGLPQQVDAEGRRVDLIFTSTRETPVSGFSRVKATIDRAMAEAAANAGVEQPAPWRIHDLRRTAATLIEDRLNVRRTVTSAILAHVDASITATYAQAELRDQKAAALEAWGRYVGEMTTEAAD